HSHAMADAWSDAVARFFWYHRPIPALTGHSSSSTQLGRPRLRDEAAHQTLHPNYTRSSTKRTPVRERRHASTRLPPSDHSSIWTTGHLHGTRQPDHRTRPSSADRPRRWAQGY